MTLAELSGLSERFSQTRGSVRGLSPTLQPDGEAELLLPQFPQPSDQDKQQKRSFVSSISGSLNGQTISRAGYRLAL